MKKPFYVLMISILIMFVSCDKDSNEPDDPEFPVEITTAADLDGHWEFVSLEVPGLDWSPVTECSGLVAWVAGWTNVLIIFDFDASTEKATITDICTGEHPRENATYYIDGNSIIIGGAVFSMIPDGYDNLTGELDLTIPNHPGTTLTVQKQ